MALRPVAAVEELVVLATARHAGRMALVALRYGPVTLDSRARRGKARASLSLWAVWMQEVSTPPPGDEPLEWMLLCTFPVETLTAAREVRSNYVARWAVEPFHKVTNSGLRAESRWVDDAAGFERLVALTLPAALWLLRLEHAARSTPEVPATDVLTATEVESLKALARHLGIKTPRRRWTVARIVLVLAMAGGYDPQRKSPPGWQVLWRGWKRFRDFHAGWGARKPLNSKG